MSLTGPTKIIGDETRAGEVGHPVVALSSSGHARLRQVTQALLADAQAARVPPGRTTGLSLVRAADAADLSARQAALAAALREWSGPTSGTLRTTALAVLAASRTARVRQEATRALRVPAEETVFEAFFRGVEGGADELLTGTGGQQ